MRSISIHLDDDVVSMLERPGEACEICSTQAFLAKSVHHLDVVIGRCDLVSQLAGAVRRIVISNQDESLGHRGTHTTDDDRQ